MKNAGWEAKRRGAGVLAGEAGVGAGEAVAAGKREKQNKKFFPGDLG